MLIFLIISKKRERKVTVFDEGSISELIGRIQHVTSVNVDTLEKKIIELKSAVKEANIAYVKLNESISDAKNVSTNILHDNFQKKQKISSTIPPDIKNDTERSNNFDEVIKNEDFGKSEFEKNFDKEIIERKKDEKSKKVSELKFINAQKKIKENVERLNTSVRVLTKDEKIMELNSRGWDARKIAESLNMGVGEVALIIEMNSHISKSRREQDDEKGV
ncbi:DUF6115 domain-containing protein [Mesoaciditoga sp.]